jgi:starch synthase
LSPRRPRRAGRDTLARAATGVDRHAAPCARRQPLGLDPFFIPRPQDDLPVKTPAPRTDAPLRVLSVTPECTPWVKTGGLGEVAASLPRALQALGLDVKVLMPAYPALGDLLAEGRVCATWPAHGPWPAGRLVQASAEVNETAGFTLLLLDCPTLFDVPGGPYQDTAGHDHADNARRFGMLSRVAALLGSDTSPWPAWRADLVHCHDWPTGLAPAYLSRLPGRAASVMTIHNLAFQGLFPLSQAKSLDLDPAWLGLDGFEYWGQLSLMKGALQFADAITTVSPTYAREIQQEPLGFGLQGVLRERAGRLHGLLNGVDTQVWNPATDPHLARRYDQGCVTEGKRANKAALQARTGLQAEPGTPLFGLVSRLTEQKGIDLVLEVLPWLVETQGAQFVALGQGDKAFEARLQALAARHPGRVAVTVGFEEALAHQIEAGADAFLMPSRFEPCGLNQMYSLLYGTPPVVHATGGLADSVVDAEAADDDTATGFVFREPTAPALQAVLQRAIDLFRGDPPAWLRLQQRGMGQRFDWAHSAAGYAALYAQLTRQAR